MGMQGRGPVKETLYKDPIQPAASFSQEANNIQRSRVAQGCTLGRCVVGAAGLAN